MLRRNKRRAGVKTDNVITKKIKEFEKIGTLGETPSKTDSEKNLEQLVIGDDGELLENLEDPKINEEVSTPIKSLKPKPVWEDEDDLELQIKVTRPKQTAGKIQEESVPAEKYTQSLKSKFEKVTGAPTWARLRWEKQHIEKSDEVDTDAEHLLQSTGNHLANSESLPKGIIQIKRCTDANKESPSRGKLKSVEFHPNAQVMLTAGMDQTLSLFQVDGKNNPKIQSVFMDKFPIYTAHFSQGGHEVIMGSKHKNFYFYDMISGKIVNVPHIKGLEENNMSRFEMSPDGKFIAFLGKYGNIHLISAQSKEWISSLKMNGSVDSICFSKDGSRMFSYGDDGEVYIWDMSTRDCLQRFKDDGCIQGTSIEASPNGQYLACGSYSGVVNIYDASNLKSKYPKPLKAVMNLTTPCTDIKFNSTSELMAIGSNYTEKAVKLVHFPSMNVFSNFPERTDDLRIPLCFDFSVNSGYFTIGGHRGHAALYRVKHYENY